MLAADGGSCRELLQDYGVKYQPLSQRQTNPLKIAASVGRLMNLCRTFKPDIIHAHMMAGAVLGKIASVLFRIPLVTTVHNSFDRHSTLMKLGDKIVAVSRAERDLLVERGYNPKKVELVVNGPNGSPREGRFEKIDGKILDAIQPPFITTVCGLHRRKGVQDLIAAFAEVASAHPAWRLYVAGDGPDRQALIELSKKLNLADQVVFLGYVKNPAEILSKADIFVLASYAEPFGLATAEARQAGCAIVATSVGGTPELLDFGKAGVLVRPESPKEIAAALDRLMSDPIELQTFKDRAKNGSEYYRVDRLVEDYGKVYASLLPGANSRVAEVASR
jgi:glycosyltransferase involved in cell wall biosynthesis